MSNFWDNDPVAEPSKGANFWDNDPEAGAAPAAAPAAGPDNRSWTEWLMGKAPNEQANQKFLAENPALSTGDALKEAAGIPLDMTGDQFKANAAGASRNILDSMTLGLGAKAIAGIGAATGSYPSYEEGLAAERSKTEQWAKENPGRAVETQILGALVPGGLAAKGVGAGMRAAGVVPNLLGKMALGGVGGATFGAASGAFHTDTDLADAADAAKKGLTEGPKVFGVTVPNAVIGAAAPVIGRAAGAVGSFMAPYFQKSAPGVGKAATAVLQDAIPTNAAQRLTELGPQATLADVSPSMLGVTQGTVQRAAGTPVADTIVGGLRERAAGAPARLQADIHENLGVPQDPEVLANHIKEYQDAVLAPKYQQLWDSNPPSVNIKPILKGIEEKLATAPTSVTRALNLAHQELTDSIQGGGYLPKSNAAALHEAKGELGDKIEFGASGLDIPKGSKANGALKDVYGQLNDALKTQVPGYSDVTAEAQKYFKLREALRNGTEVLGGESAWPETFKQTFSSLEPAAQQAIREGMASTVGKSVGRNINDLAPLKRLVGGDLDWNRANMTTAFGPQNTQNMANAVGREQTFADTLNKVAEGSQTAPRLAGERAVAQAQLPGIPRVPVNATMFGTGMAALQRGGSAAYEALRGMHHGNVLGQLGQAVSQQASPYRDALVQALLAGKGLSERAGQSVSNLAGNPALAAALMASGRSQP